MVVRTKLQLYQLLKRRLSVIKKFVNIKLTFKLKLYESLFRTTLLWVTNSAEYNNYCV